MFNAKIKSFMNLDYELIDFGNGFKLERFGRYKLMRPEPRAIGKPNKPLSKWNKDSICLKTKGMVYKWDPVLSPWLVNFGNFKFELKLSHSKNIGIFPEQQSNWLWLLSKVKPGMNLLNLFAHTGFSSLICAKAGAAVCHVDSSKSIVRQAIRNASLNEVGNIRWIIDDVRLFLKREIKRKVKYDGIILDPPPFGCSKNQKFLFKNDIHYLLDLCRRVYAEKPILFLINCYSVPINLIELKYIVKNQLPTHFPIETGELKNSKLPMSIYARF